MGIQNSKIWSHRGLPLSALEGLAAKLWRDFSICEKSSKHVSIADSSLNFAYTVRHILKEILLALHARSDIKVKYSKCFGVPENQDVNLEDITNWAAGICPEIVHCLAIAEGELKVSAKYIGPKTLNAIPDLEEVISEPMVKYFRYQTETRQSLPEDGWSVYVTIDNTQHELAGLYKKVCWFWVDQLVYDPIC